MGKEKVVLYGVLFFLVLVSFQNCGNVNLKTADPIDASSSAPANPAAPVDNYVSPFVDCVRSWKTSPVFDTRTGSDYGSNSVLFKDKLIIHKAIQNSSDLYSPTVIMKTYDPKTNTFADFPKTLGNIGPGYKCYFNKLHSDSKTILAASGVCQISPSLVMTYIFVFNESTNTWVKENIELSYSVSVDSKGNLWAIQSRWNSSQQKYSWDIYKRISDGGGVQWVQQATHDLDSGYVPGLIISKKDEIFISTPKLTRTGPVHFHLIHVKSNQLYPIAEQLTMRSELEDGYTYSQKGDSIYFSFMKNDSSSKVVEFDFDKLSSRVVGETQPSVAQPQEVVRRTNNTLLMWSFMVDPDFTEFKTSDLSLVKSSTLDFNLNGQLNYFASVQITTRDNGDFFVVGSSMYQNFSSVVRAYTCNQ